MRKVTLLIVVLLMASMAVNAISLNANFEWLPENPTDLEDVHFYDTSEGNVVAWVWYFGDGESSTEKNPVHRYEDNGTYTVRLVVWDKYGNMDYVEKDIVILNVPPVADAGEDIISNEYLVAFNASSSYDPDGSITDYIWDFGDGDTAHGKKLSHEYENEGIYNVELTVYDNDGASNSDGINVLVDVTPPKTNYSLEEEKEWYNNKVNVTLNATDNLAGVNVTKYKINDGDWENYTGSFNVSEEGINKVYFYSIDNASNEEAEKNVTIRIDYTKPETNYTINATYGNNGWIRSSAKIKFSAKDNLAGVNVTKYKINDGDWENYTGEITISVDGIHTIRFYSIDNAGNREDERNFTIKIDTKEPTVALNLPKEGYIYIAGREIIPTLFDRTYIIGKFTAEVTANDTRSGIAYVEFILNNQTLFKDYVAPYTAELPQEFPLSINTLKAIAYDNAGNKAESTEITYIKIF